MKRILCLIDSLGPGGAQRQLVGLASFLKARDYDITVLYYHDNTFYLPQLMSNRVNHVYLKKANSKFLRIIYIANYIRKINPDVVISYLETPSICASIAHLFNRTFKLVVSERNTTQYTGLSEKVRFNFFRLADYIVPNSFAQADYIGMTFPFLKSQVVVIPNFVDLYHFSPGCLRYRHDIPQIIIVATIWESKNTLGFIDAVAKLKEKGHRFHIKWYGKDRCHLDYFDQCFKKIDDLGLSNYIELKEKSSNICEKYQESDYFCLPSFYEGTPNALCEAMACGLPITCSDVCDNGRYVVEGKNGTLFDPRNVDSIVIAIERILSINDDEYQSYCRESRARAEYMLSEDKFVKSYIKIIEQ